MIFLFAPALLSIIAIGAIEIISQLRGSRRTNL